MDRKEELLTQAKLLYCRGESDYRDKRLELGRVIHEYVLECLQENEQLNEANRIRIGITRARIIKKLAEELSCKPAEVRDLICIAMTAWLLGNGELGKMSLKILRLFICFIERISCKGSPISSRETWWLKEPFAEKSKVLFLESIENTNYENVRAAVLRLYSGPAARPRSHRRGRTSEEKSALAVIKCGMKRASPGDVAQTCLELVEANEEPWIAAQRVIAQLQQIKKPRPTYI